MGFIGRDLPRTCDYDAAMIRVLVIALALLACGKQGNGQADKEIDQYINHDYGPHLSRVFAARAAYADIKADDILEKPATVRYRIHDVALPFLNQSLDGLSKITPPAAAKQYHESEIEVLTRERDAIAEMDKALDNPEMFKVAHARMMDVQEGVMSSERSLDKLLADHHLVLANLPKVEIPKQQDPAPPAAQPAQPAQPRATEDIAPNCKEGTAKRAADDFVTCETELMFSPPETVAGTPRESVVVCGPGELIYAPTGAVVSCVSVGKLKIGETDIAKGAKITFGDKAHVMKAVLPDGKSLCFDDNNASTPCP